MSNITITTTQLVNVEYEARLIVLFNLLIKTVAQCLDGFSWILGNIGSILTCIVFYQPAFRKSPGAMYFIASSFSQFFIFNFAVFIRMIQYGYGVPVNSVPVWFYKVRFYIFYVASANARYNIIFASMDRFFISSRNALRRQWSSSKIAFRLIVINAIVWLLIYVQILVFFDVKNDKCRFQNVTIMTIFSFCITMENVLIPIFFMLFFGLLIINNVHDSKRRANGNPEININVAVQNNKLSRKEIQFHKMLVNQVILYLILNIPFPVYTMYRTYLGISSLSGSRALMDTFINNLTFDLIYLNFALTFFNFMLTSDMFRREFKQLIQRKLFDRCRQRIVPKQ